MTMSKKNKNRVPYWVTKGSKLWHMRADCPELLKNAEAQQQVPELIGSMEIGMRGLQPCRCAGGSSDEGVDTQQPK